MGTNYGFAKEMESRAHDTQSCFIKYCKESGGTQ